MNRTLALTISGPDRSGRYASNRNVYIEDKYMLEKGLRLCCSGFILYPEIEKGRLHYHGLVIIKDYVKWHKSVLPKIKNVIGFVCIKDIKTQKDKLRWLIYSMAEWATTQQVLLIDEPIMPHKPVRIQRIPTDNKLDEGITKWFPVVAGP